MKGIITPLAGKTTKVDINIALAVTVTLSVVVNGFQAVKGGFRRRELNRLRQRCDDLELALLSPGQTTG